MLPKLHMPLGDVWMPVTNGSATLDWKRPDFYGALQSSCPGAPLAEIRRGADSALDAGRSLEKVFGRARSPTEGSCAYGHYLSWRHDHPEEEHVQAWLLLHEADAPHVLFTWYGNENPLAESLVLSASPATPASPDDVAALAHVAADTLAAGDFIEPAIYATTAEGVLLIPIPDPGRGAFLARLHAIAAAPSSVGVMLEGPTYDGERRVYMQWETPHTKDAFSAVVDDDGRLGPVTRASYQPLGAAHDFFDTPIAAAKRLLEESE